MPQLRLQLTARFSSRLINHYLMTTKKAAHHRPIRSFVRREGRLTPAQQRALDEIFPRYAIDTTKSLIDPAEIFGNSNPLVLEIGFGNGTLLATQAKAYPDFNFIGLEVHRPGVGHLLQKLEKENLNNVRVVSMDAMEVLEQNIPDKSLHSLWLFFPDPWPKKKHHKRRIVKPAFLQLVANKLTDQGILHMATDWQDYADHMKEAVENSQLFRPVTLEELAHYPFARPQTHFEQRGLRKGHNITDLYFHPNAINLA